MPAAGTKSANPTLTTPASDWSPSRPAKPAPSKSAIAKKVDNASRRSNATPNGNNPAQERQRVRRACENCRKKKIKCNGEEPCQRCLASQGECEYADFVAPMRADTSNVEKLESRVASIESLFRQFLDTFSATNGRPNISLPNVADVARDHESNDATVIGNFEQENTMLPVLTAPGDLPEGDDVENQMDDNASNEDDEEAPDNVHEKETYADGFGELEADTNGQLRYVGLGSTASVVDTCVGLRRRITQGLEKKGYEGGETFLTSPVPTGATTSNLQNILRDEMPPQILVDTLIDIYLREISFLFPIITETDVRSLQDRLLHEDNVDCASAAIFFGVLAVSAPLIPKEHGVFNDIGSKYLDGDMGTSFYDLGNYFANSFASEKAERRGTSQDIVLALGLLSLYLAEMGSQAESWIMVGRAIRLGQDLGLHRSPKRLQLPWEEGSKRRYLWWCLYILERQLSIALGRPLSIDDADCDVEIPSESIDGSHCEGTAGFISMIHLHKILGVILRTVNSVRNADNWREVKKYEELQIRVRESNLALQTWAKEQVPPQIKNAKSGLLLTQKHVALSSFFSGVILLHRVYMSNPHRPSPLEDSQAQLRSAKAATNCIHGTPEFLKSVPKCHYLVFHGQYVFVSAIVLLQCVRSSEDMSYIDSTLKDVELALESLRSLEKSWKGAKKCHGIVEEYLEFTLDVLESDKKGVCNFSHGCDEVHGKQASRQPEKVSTNRKRNQPSAPSRNSKRKSIKNSFSPARTHNSSLERLAKRRKHRHFTDLGISPPSLGDHNGPHSKSRHIQSSIPSYNTQRTLDYTSHSRLPQQSMGFSAMEMPSPGNLPGTHLDDVIGSFLGVMPDISPTNLQQDPFLSGFNVDFDDGELTLFTPEIFGFQ